MLTNDQLLEFADTYASDKRSGFRRWFNKVLNWAENRDIEAEVKCMERKGERTFYIRFRLSDSRGAFYASVFHHIGALRGSVEAECSEACAQARRDRMLAFNGRIAARIA